MIVVFTGDYIETMNIRNLLQDFNIESFLLNEYMATIRPHAVTAGGFNPVSLQVSKEDVDKAQKILEEYRNGSFSL